MKKSQPLGLDELMIVNPGAQSFGACFLGEDGTLYLVQAAGEDRMQGLGEFFLGDDGTLYKVEHREPATVKEQPKSSSRVLNEDQRRDIRRFFLGDDGTLYEVVNSSAQR
jgi:hypothetical protein